MHEPSINDISAVIEDVIKVLKPFSQEPFTFFGHSLGGLVAFEVSHRLNIDSAIQPTHLFVSGCAAPCNIKNIEKLSQLTNRQLYKELRQLQGTADEVLHNEELMQLLLPRIRADFAIYESYESYYSKQQRQMPLECSMTVFGGIEDTTVDYKKLYLWQKEIIKPIELFMIPGNHFFLHSAEAILLAKIRQKLSTILQKVA